MLKVKNVLFGEGMPKICVPITAKCEDNAKEEAYYICEEKKDSVDLVELRIDYLEEVGDNMQLQNVLKQIQHILGDIPLLCTLRTAAEGGELEVTEEQYDNILCACIDSGAIDMLDVEYYRGKELFQKISSYAHEKGVMVVGSNHDFQETPKKEELVQRLTCMEAAGADIAKIAVMPKDEQDVITVLDATLEARESINVPVVTISMGKMGLISRLAGQTFGSCITFGVGRKASAPGQIDADALKEVLRIIG